MDDNSSLHNIEAVKGIGRSYQVENIEFNNSRQVGLVWQKPEPCLLDTDVKDSVAFILSSAYVLNPSLKKLHHSTD